MSRKRIEMASRLKACITAGIGSDHIDLAAAAEHKVDVAEITFSNSISVAEHGALRAHAQTRVRRHAALSHTAPPPPTRSAVSPSVVLTVRALLIL